MKNDVFKRMKKELAELTERIEKLRLDVETYPARQTPYSQNQLMFMMGYQFNLEARVKLEEERRKAVYGGKKS